MDLTTSFTEDFLTCSICCKVYTRPVCLPCCHSFCEVCLQTFIRKSIENDKKILCSICKKTFKSESRFEYDHALLNLIEELSVKGNLLCSFCQLRSEQKEVVSKCLTCNELLCDVCSSSRHTFTTLTAYHNVVSYKDFLAGKYEAESTSIVCKKHPGMNIEFYCRDCRISFCKDCFYFEHRGHDYVNISLVKTGIERETEKVLENLSKTSDALKQKEFSLASIENEIIENEKTSLEQVAITFDNFLDKLTCQRQIAENKIKQNSKEEKQKISTLIHQNSQTRKELKVIVSFYEKLLSSKRDSKIICLGLDVRKSLGVVETLGCTEVNVSFIDIKKSDEKDFNAFDLKIIKSDKTFGTDGFFIHSHMCDATEKSLSRSVVVKETKNVAFAQAPVLSEPEHQNDHKICIVSSKQEHLLHPSRKPVKVYSDQIKDKESCSSTEHGKIGKDLEQKTRVQNISDDNTVSRMHKETFKNSMKNETRNASSISKAATSEEWKQADLDLIPECSVAIDIYGKEEKPRKIVYTNVTWIDKSTFVVTDKENAKLILIKFAGEHVERRLIPVEDAITVAKFYGYLAVKGQTGKVKIFNYPELEHKQTFDSVSAIASHSSKLILVTNSYIEIFCNGKIEKKVSFKEKGKEFIFNRVFEACYLPNKTLAVTDACDRCLFFINSEGNIRNRVFYVESGSYGAISCDKNNLVYLASYNEDVVNVYNTEATCVRIISLCGVLFVRSIDVLLGKQMLIVTQDMVRLYSL